MSASKPPSGFEFLDGYRMEIDYEQINRESITRAVSEGIAQRLSGRPTPRCHAQLDGDCDWANCPQKTDYRTICPLVNREEDDR